MNPDDHGPGGSVPTGSGADRSARKDRSARRRGRAERSRRAPVALPKPSPLPPHPEGLRPSFLPPLLTLVSFVVLLIGVAGGSNGLKILGAVALGLVILYATMTRNDRRRQLLYAYVVGHRQFSAGDYQAALTNFTDMEESDFAPPAVLRGIGLSSYHLGHWAETSTYLEDVPDRTPEEDAILAHALVELGEYDEAVDRLDRSGNATALGRVVRAVAALRRGRPAESVEILRALLGEFGGERAPAEEPFLGARYWLGLALRDIGQPEDAREVLAALHELDPDYHDVARQLG